MEEDRIFGGCLLAAHLSYKELLQNGKVIFRTKRVLDAQNYRIQEDTSMCGIVGYIGQSDCKEILLHGLEKLEYRGYDSAGIAGIDHTGLHISKEKGRIADLRQIVVDSFHPFIGIGHTRWATHGAPSKKNAHPHQSSSKRFTLVHNGVIENYDLIKHSNLDHIHFISDTDTEVIVQLVEKYVEQGMYVEEAFRHSLKRLHGSYAIGLIDAQDSDTLYAAKNRSPLLVGLGDGFNVITSDAIAVLQITNQFLELKDQEVVILKKDRVIITDLYGEIQERKPFTTQLDPSDIDKGTYPHYMLKEIDEQPMVLRKIVQRYQDENGQLIIDREIREAMQKADRIYMIACGTSYHAGLVGKDYLEKFSGIPTEVHIASEFSYNLPLLSQNPLFILISQSGETADSRSVLVKVKEKGYPTLAITNVPDSTLSRESDCTLLLHAGPEIAVASTKAYTAQIAVLALLAVDTAIQKGLPLDFDIFSEFGKIATVMDGLIHNKEIIAKIALNYLQHTRNCFFIGRGLDYYVGLEGALKLKEISYIQCEGFAGGELKHGTIALIEEKTPVIVLVTQESVNLNIRGNAKEVAARGAHVCVIATENLTMDGDAYVLPKVYESLSPRVSVIPLQLLAYYAALQRGCDVDKPRNLAKSVTVE